MPASSDRWSEDWTRSVPMVERSGGFPATTPPLLGARHSVEAELSTLRLSAFGLTRVPPRPIEDRQPGYDELFDYDTLFYDVFREADGQGVICLGPPLLNTVATPSRVVFRVPGSAAPIQAEYRAPRSRFQPNCQFRLTGRGLEGADQIAIALGDREIIVRVSGSGRCRFAGRRVLLTLSKDNPIAWIRDWAEFNVRVHGADALLLYDNGSTLYGPGELAEYLADIPGLVSLLIVPWNFPYGPGVGPRNIQDSFYCQPGALDHARRRYCAGARSVLNTDIDELAVSTDGSSLFERVERSGAAAIVFPGVWVEMTGSRDEQPPRPVRHTDCLYGRRWQAILRKLRRRGRLLRTKWVAVPSMCAEDADWAVHDVYWSRPQTVQRPTDITYRHFRQINTGWKTDRARLRPYSWFNNVYDRELAESLALAFPESAEPRTTRQSAAGFQSLIARWKRPWLRRRKSPS